MSCQWSRLHKPIGLICMFLVLAAVACSSTPPAPPPEVDPLAGVRTLVQQQQWVMALNRLEAHRERGSADWHQLMAYCLLQRQLQAGLAGRVHMERLVRPHLDAALAANPGHRASLQTAGLLALELGDIAGARRFWVALDESCFLPCRPSLALQAAIEESVDPQAGWE